MTLLEDRPVDAALHAPAGDEPPLPFLHEAFAQWLADPGVTVACGRWQEGGALAELVPQGRAYLLPARYGEPFSGVRELRIEGSGHHLHIDFGRIERLVYAVAPSVCLAFKPSFEVRLQLRDAPAALGSSMVSLMLSAPYRGDALDRVAVRRYFERAAAHARSRPDLVQLSIAGEVRQGAQGAAILAVLGEAVGLPGADWPSAQQALMPEPAAPPRSAPFHDDPPCRALLEQALALTEASLVIYRHQLLVEFQTEQLGGLRRYEEQGHVSWQLGDTRHHHCHLSLATVQRVLFSAEPVECQGGGLNYTVWFLSASDSGNPWRPDGYFSVVLNRPYQGDRPRPEVIEPVFALYRHFSDQPWVQADRTFLACLRDGPPPRR